MPQHFHQNPLWTTNRPVVIFPYHRALFTTKDIRKLSTVVAPAMHQRALQIAHLDGVSSFGHAEGLKRRQNDVWVLQAMNNMERKR